MASEEGERLEAFRRELRRRVRGEVGLDEVSRGIYSTDASLYQVMPRAVAAPRDEDDVREALACAREHRVPVTSRGGGTSLGGQAVGPGLILDFSAHLAELLEVNVEERWARVRPGIVLDVLNDALAPHRLHFAPDPATASRATIGGMIGNNSSGTKSIVYGITRDHVLELRALLADGTELRFGELSAEEYERRSGAGGHGNGAGGGNGGARAREAEILRGLRRIVQEHRGEIETRYPKVMRRVQGYNLDAFTSSGPWNLSKLLVGSEGTLALTLEAKLRLEPLPAARALCVGHFEDRLEAIRQVASILEHSPSAVEILDADLIGPARRNLETAPLCGFLEGDPRAVLIVEFFGESAGEAAEKARRLAADLEARRAGYAWPVILEPAEQAKVWKVRKSGLGLMLGRRGGRKPIAFIEDAAIPIPALAEYIERVLEFCERRGVPVAMYAHASVGTIHVRPILDLKRGADIESMKAIAEFSLERVLEYGGSWSGEHGDGRVRSPFLERFFGPQVYGALREVKRLFDPEGLLNPGVIVDAAPMDRDLRYGTGYRAAEIPTSYHYREDGSFAAAVEMCTGVGACRQVREGTMCPSYRATRDEVHSPRGRANALRLAMSGQLGPEGLSSQGLYDALDLCLGCKACKSECPSNVDVARLKGEILQRWHQRRGTSRRERAIAGSARTAARLAGWKAPIANWLQKRRAVRWLLEKTLGIDRRRILPAHASRPLARWFEGRRPPPASTRRGTVVLFDDTFMSYHEPRVGISAVELLEACGYEVLLARAGCCQRPRISHGFLREAREEGEATLRRLDEYLRQGLPVLVCEPSCASALTDDLPGLIEDEELGRRVREGVVPIEEFLDREAREGRLDEVRFSARFDRVVLHGHCHQKSLWGTGALRRVLSLAEGLEVEEIDSGCCGMAGSFGYEVEHHELSLRIGEERLFPAVRARPRGAAVVACGFSCRHQIAAATGVEAMHWVEAVRASAELKPERPPRSKSEPAVGERP